MFYKETSDFARMHIISRSLWRCFWRCKTLPLDWFNNRCTL